MPKIQNALKPKMSQTVPFKPIQQGTWKENHQKYMTEKAKGVTMPTDEAAQLKPLFMFDDPTFVLQMCFTCRKLNRNIDVVQVNEEYQQFPLSLCKICCANFNIQRRNKFFNHDLLVFKRENNIED
ncbi:hypothetical protein GCK72_021155 [Caenorhabditis remanei]|uniref:Uncharacterized protein n=2 Tax=Caenorhabditis TaxID=6237 RepID=A0A6A5G4B3_CAERE|nr:hypothetical protein GCK72_026249 [Caenorhabditis remanei]XP_053582975.1 hypothetical protein GCK72_021155 [Caenorhabditis remanei]KAF1749780.1 hypothetical protein GCK72_026249 [Caenorhabditis remanei]KAF1754592.1 hypothetical protein GCK72_021155 [Caenorhabditis remanei]